MKWERDLPASKADRAGTVRLNRCPTVDPLEVVNPSLGRRAVPIDATETGFELMPLIDGRIDLTTVPTTPAPLFWLIA